MAEPFQSAIPPSSPSLDFSVDDLLNLPDDDDDDDNSMTPAATATAPIHGSSSRDSSSSYNYVRDSQNNDSVVIAAAALAAGVGGSSFSAAAVGTDDRQFVVEIGIPLEEIAELEWLSNFLQDSFSAATDDGHWQKKLQLTQSFQPQLPTPTPAKARSKRSRSAPGNWTSRLLAVSNTETSSSDSSETAAVVKKPPAKRIRKEGGDGGGGDGEGRRCLHCATDKTPQWRTGPMGPKTLCNACGVRYKSGRLVPEYRPAASPTFVLTKHSNSHRKVLELRRQKEMMTNAQPHQQHQPYMDDEYHHHHLYQHHHQGMIFEASSNGEDYLIHQNLEQDFGNNPFLVQ